MTTETRVAWGQRIKSARISSGISAAQAADHMGVHVSTISRWESGDSFPDIDGFFKILSFYGVTETDLALSQRPDLVDISVLSPHGQKIVLQLISSIRESEQIARDQWVKHCLQLGIEPPPPPWDS